MVGKKGLDASVEGYSVVKAWKDVMGLLRRGEVRLWRQRVGGSSTIRRVSIDATYFLNFLLVAPIFLAEFCCKPVFTCFFYRMSIQG